MGIMVGGSGSQTAAQVKRANGSTGSFRISKPNQKKKKRLNYNFKAVSSQILLSKTSNSAGKVVTKARGKLASLLRKVGSDDYDDTELRHAIIHARKMERVAKRRQKHLKQEEDIEQKGKNQEQEDVLLEGVEDQEVQDEQLEMTEEELRQLLEEYERLMQQAMEEAMQELEMEELAEEFSEAVYEMEPEDLEQLKKKHRTDEAKEIADADMKYLRSVFNRLEREKQALSAVAKSGYAQMPAVGGVSMEMSGLEIPIEMPEVPPVVQGTSIDMTL